MNATHTSVRAARTQVQVLLLLVIALCLAWLATPAQADPPYVPQGPPYVFPAAGSPLPGPPRVPGKEYSTHTPGAFGIGDEDHFHVLDPEQVLNWDGAGGTFDGIDFSGTRPNDPADREVDALANHLDALFREVTSDASNLLFSVDDDGAVYYEKPGAPVGGIWAPPPMVDGVHPPEDLDALEVWGPEPGSILREGDPPFIGDADRYSLESTGPLGIPDPLGISVWDKAGVPVWSQLEIATIVSLASGIPLGEVQPELINLDAMMNFSGGGPDGGALEEIMFSIDPIGPFDGGEIFVGAKTPAAGVVAGGYLFHGGHFWDTPFPVADTYGLRNENINALEAASIIPEPATIVLVGMALVGLIGFRPCGRKR